jgi:hypothetical protein
MTTTPIQLAMPDKESELEQIKALGKDGTLDGLHQFASTLTARAKELQALEASYNIGRGQATEILHSMIESFVYAAIRTGVNREYNRHDVVPRTSARSVEEIRGSLPKPKSVMAPDLARVGLTLNNQMRNEYDRGYNAALRQVRKALKWKLRQSTPEVKKITEEK